MFPTDAHKFRPAVITLETRECLAVTAAADYGMALTFALGSTSATGPRFTLYADPWGHTRYHDGYYEAKLLTYSDGRTFRLRHRPQVGPGEPHRPAVGSGGTTSCT